MNLFFGLLLVSHLYTSHYENVLGTSLELKVSAVSQQASDKAQKAVLDEIARLNNILSAYDPNSEFSKWEHTRNIATPVSMELYEVLDLFDQWRTRTDGALDASAEAITKVWKKAASEKRLPTPKELDLAIQLVKQQHWTLDPRTRTATHLDEAPLMLNSFAKSYIIHLAAEKALAVDGIKGVVVNIGGDLVIAGDIKEPVWVSDPKADAENDPPLSRLTIDNRAVATSGNYRRGELIAGHWYSHIVDPRTGHPADDILSATVIAPNAADAGALATAFNVLSPNESQQLAAKMPGVDYLIITRDGRRIESPRWKTLESAANPQPPKAGPFEMLVNLEITQQQDFAKRPYVAVWVEDQNHAPIRTISVWHGSDRYLPELKSWYLKYRGLYLDDKNFNASITSATRSAGKYTVRWDGLDDHGNPVKPGNYVIKIEASREHGTYQLMRQEIACDDAPKKLDLTGNPEITSASLDYHKN